MRWSSYVALFGIIIVLVVWGFFLLSLLVVPRERPRAAAPSPVALQTVIPTLTVRAVVPETLTPSPTATLTSILPTPTPSPTATPTTLPPTATPSPVTSGPVEVPAQPLISFPTLVAVQTSTHEGFDRVVFEFANRLPNYRFGYIQPPILAEASGMPVPIGGSAFLRIRFSPAVAHDDSGESTFEVHELMSDLPILVEALQIGDFEGVVTWVLGLSQKGPLEINELRNPFQVIVDVYDP